ncbi:MAG: NACHT domain-containing protein [Microcoleus sp.]
MGKPTPVGKLAQATINFTQKVAMARKYGKNATTKNNVFKLVEALLALADGEIVVPGDKLKATFNVEWVKEDELLVSGKIQQKRNNKTQTVEKGITKDDLWALVECLGEALELSQPKDEKNVDNAQRRGEAIQDVLDCLKDLDILVLKPSAKTQGFWKFHLKLKHQTAEKKDNLKVIEERWKIKIGSVTLEISHETPKPKEETINWQEICRQNLALQKELTTNLFTNANGMTPQLDGVYVPLAIVERQKPKPQPRNQQEEKEKETEKLIPIAEERFFEDVLRQGKSEISQGRKIAIIGEPGAGKTTRLQKIADWILEQELGLPIWIDLAELGDKDICQYLEKVWLSRCQGEVTRRDLEPQINRVWLLLDGVDEMANTQGMQQLGKDLLRTWVQAARVVVTCRVNVWEADKNAFSGFDVFRNLEFNAEQVTEYIRRWFAGMGDAATGESLEAELAESENSRLKELIQNPLRLWMLCQIWSSRQGTLPDTQAKLYASFIKYFYRWKEQIIEIYEKLCGKTEKECQKLLHEGLGELAKAAIDGKSSRFRLSYRLVSEYLGDRNDETSLLSLALSLGWLNRVGIDFDEPEESVYGFYHATFQEYFAALAVDDWDYFLPRNHVNFPVVGKEYRIFEAQWKQVILLWLGLEGVGKEEKEEFIGRLAIFSDGCGDDLYLYKYRAFFLIALGIVEFKKHFLSSQTVEVLIAIYFKNNLKSYFSDSIIETIKNTDIVDSVNYIIKFIEQHDSIETYRKTLNILEIIGVSNQLAINFLIERIKLINATQESEILFSTLDTLQKISINSPETLFDLIDLMYSNPNYSWAYAVAFIGIYSRNSEFNNLLKNKIFNSLNNTTNEMLICSFAYSLLQIDQNNETAIQLLDSMLTSTDEDICRKAAYILGEMNINKEKSIMVLNSLIKSADEDIRRKSAYSLCKIDPGNSTAITTLILLIQLNKDVRKKTATNLIQIMRIIKNIDSEVIELLLEIFINTQDEYIRDRITDIFIVIKANLNNHPLMMNLLEQILKPHNNNLLIRRRSAEILSQIAINNEEVINYLIMTIESIQDEDLWRSCAYVLGHISQNNERAKECLLNRLDGSIEDKNCLRSIYLNLYRIDRKNPHDYIDLLTSMILNNKSDFVSHRIMNDDLKTIIAQESHSQISIKILGLLNKYSYNDFLETNYSYQTLYDILWNCAQNLPYPTFYQAWHHQLTTPHPEVPETTGVGSTPFTQSLNLADLPKILDARLVETQLIESLQLICIDTSKFIDTNNPALEIYEQFLDKNCPQRPNGEPETLPQLKSYWNRLRRHSDKHPILIFYQDPTSPAAQGFSPTFLDALTRFDGTICLITDSPHPPLQTFSPHDPDLLQTVVNWLKRVHFES